ncbi:hypothetical protein F8388_019074 [Cannabis sativa]|uniref:Terpene synthase n=1 Tax=Cannabis sativa TaxID=3483 RepID=A0A7J6FCD5_CANSA|nr:hypothetical protein F8388_019074 [Cannabis sativa]
MSLISSDEKRPNLAEFTPSIWGDYFMSCASNDDHSSLKETMENNKESYVKIIELKEQVKKKLLHGLQPLENPLETLEYIDDIQRLGLSYYFENEIEQVLKQFHNNNNNLHHDFGDNNLYADALRFRLLREQGYFIACEVFAKYKNEKGKFKESISSDIRGMLNLYEASQMRVRREEILDEALIFTTTHLQSLVETSQLSSPYLDLVKHALMHPIRKSFQRREARLYISLYRKLPSHEELLLTLAKLDFNLLQQLHQKELNYITRWWKEFDFKSKQSFSRDRIVECYIWNYGVYFEAQTSQIRLMMTKLISLLTIIDDSYDSYGTLEELRPFTEAWMLERWDIFATDNLPEYMKVCYKKCLEFFNEIEEFTKENSFCASYVKKGLQCMVRAYSKEVQWLHNKYMPTFDEYYPIGLDNAGSEELISMAFCGMGDVVTKESMDWIFSQPQPNIIRTMSIVGRLMNDIGYHKCYIKQYGVTYEEAIEKLNEQVNDSWKDLNEDLLYPIAIPRPLLMRVLNLVRVNHEMYREGDGFTQPTLLKNLIDTLIINPIY